MQFLITHWHCILPALGIVAALVFMRDKKKEDDSNITGSKKDTFQKEND